jgi:hypothetical protein
LRPLNLGDMYDAAFRIIRFNPKATVGSAVLVGLSPWPSPSSSPPCSPGPSASPGRGDGGVRAETAGVIGLVALAGAGHGLQSIGLHPGDRDDRPCHGGRAVGRRLSLGEAWAATHGKRWRLIGLARCSG